MEYEIKTIVCPNCGANTTNHQNCEYCGSMLVRCYEMMGIDEDSDEEDEKEVFKLFGKSAYTNEYLSERVKKIIDLSAKYGTEIRGDIYSYINASHERFYSNVPYENILTIISDNQRDTLTLIIKFNMQSAYQNRHFGYFEDKSFSKLLTIRQEDSIMLCSMEIDKNEKTAAKFIKYIVEEFFRWKENKYECRIFGTINGESKEFVPKLEQDRKDRRKYLIFFLVTNLVFWLFMFLSIMLDLGLGLSMFMFIILVVTMLYFVFKAIIVGQRIVGANNSNYEVYTELTKYRSSDGLLSEE